MIRIINEIPESIKHGALDEAVKKYSEDSPESNDPVGTQKFVIGKIADSLFFGNKDIDVWVDENNGDVKSFFVGQVIKDIDNEWSYVLSYPYVSKEFRSNGYSRAVIEKVKEKAKDFGCKHLTIVTKRTADAVNRFTGQEFKETSHVLKMEL